jgi:hypothetical protein
MSVEYREWNQEQLREYIATLHFVIDLIDSFPKKSATEIKIILQDCIKRECL